MYIKSVIVDGFKSYGGRNAIAGFDPTITAITGYNDSGKTNFLDALCFALGFFDKEKLPVDASRNLIHNNEKNDHSNATVSITFDNKDKRRKLRGYESSDEINITTQLDMRGRYKYHINGKMIDSKSFHDLFCSVQMHVNSPHLIITKGYFNKVLQMNPPEILSLIEDAASINAYEINKVASLEIIANKDTILQSLNATITDTITPKMNNMLRNLPNREVHLAYQRTLELLNDVEKLQTSYQYVQTSKKYNDAEDKAQAARDDIKAQEAAIFSNQKEVNSIDNRNTEIKKLDGNEVITNCKEHNANCKSEIAQVELEIEMAACKSKLATTDSHKSVPEVYNDALHLSWTKATTKNATVLSELEAELGLLMIAAATTTNVLKLAKADVVSHENRTRQLEQRLRREVTEQQIKKAALDQGPAAYEHLRLASKESETALKAAQDKLLAVMCGHEGPSTSFHAQLSAAMSEDSEVGSRIVVASIEKEAAEKKLAKLRDQAASYCTRYQQNLEQKEAQKQAQFEALQSELSSISYEKNQHVQLKIEIRALEDEVRNKQDMMNRLPARLKRCLFKYSPPEENFDAGRVFGTIAELIDVSDPTYLMGLEIVAGERLFDVVVDTYETKRLLLNSLKSPVGIIPLTMKPLIMNPADVAFAQDIGGGPENVQLAVDVVKCDSRVRPAMGYVFGHDLLCRSLVIGGNVACHPRVLRRCVTFDGDISQPGGTITGGSAIPGGWLLLQIEGVKKSEQELKMLQEKLAARKEEHAVMELAEKKYNDIKHKYDILTYELGSIRCYIHKSSYAQTKAEIRIIEQKVAELTAAIERDQVTQEENAAKVAKFKDLVTNIKTHRDREHSDAEIAIEQARHNMEMNVAPGNIPEDESMNIQIDTETLKQCVAASQTTLNEASVAAELLKETLVKFTAQQNTTEEAKNVMEARVKRQKTEISGLNTEMIQRQSRKEQLLRANLEHQLKIQELQVTLQNAHSEATLYRMEIRRLEKKNRWISRDKGLFGAPDGAYDFAGKRAYLDPARLVDLRGQRDRMARRLNSRADLEYREMDLRYKVIMQKKASVEFDRNELLQVIHLIDKQKGVVLIKMCEQVNINFTSILSKLIPGGQAELKPPDGGTVLDGLEIHVNVNNTWTKSMNELSLEQRSLVALSLVFAILLIKAAPIIFLDEPDAELNYDQTEILADIMRSNFKNSQFIVTTSQEVMYNNADVVFETTNVGTATIIGNMVLQYT